MFSRRTILARRAQCQLGVLDQVCVMADDAWDQPLAGRELDDLPRLSAMSPSTRDSGRGRQVFDGVVHDIGLLRQPASKVFEGRRRLFDAGLLLQLDDARNRHLRPHGTILFKIILYCFIWYSVRIASRLIGTAASDRAALEAAQALPHILRPDDRLAELAVAYAIDAAFVC